MKHNTEEGMPMEPEVIQTLAAYANVPQPLILTTRRFRRTARFGTHVWRSVTRNFDYDTEIEHIEMACPGYTLTDRGPVIDDNEDE